jgi:hypothetical protein
MLSYWFLGSFSDPEDGGYIFLQNVGCYTALYPRELFITPL